MQVQRRDFLKTMLAAGAFPLLPGCFSTRSYAVNGKVRLAAIGCGAQAWFDLRMLAGNNDVCEVVALCDTDIGAKHTLAALKRFPKLPRFQDFRKMFDAMADKIDAVLVGIPDHSHFCAAMHAMRLGKHVYVEKPLAHSFLECELLRKAEEKYGVVCQLGNQGHSGDNYSQYREYAEKGVIKDVTRIVAHMNMERRWHKWEGKVSGYPKAGAMPKTLDWDTWVGAAPFHDFSKDLVYGEWRCWFDYGMGCMGDWGAHILDTIHRFTLCGDLPAEVKIYNLRGHNAYVYPAQDTLEMVFPATAKHGEIGAEAVVLTAGTFLRGTIHIGHETVSGGGNGQPAANALADQLRAAGLSVARLKTGTPPRLDPRSLHYDRMVRQDGLIAIRRASFDQLKKSATIISQQYNRFLPDAGRDPGENAGAAIRALSAAMAPTPEEMRELYPEAEQEGGGA